MLAKAFFIAIGLFLLLTIVFTPRMSGIKRAFESSCMQTSHALGLALYSYAQDHSQKYPRGTTSTEVFQQLLDGGYVTDPSIFYIPLPGKIAPVPGQKLRPENVSWDFTLGASTKDSPSLPLLFMTGFAVTYAPGGSAVPITKPFPPFGESSGWSWLWSDHSDRLTELGLAVFYVGNNARFIKPADPNATEVANFVPPDFDAQGKTYRQLTPGSSIGGSPPSPTPTDLQKPPSQTPPVAGHPWTNLQGVTFVPAGTDGVLFSIWDVRVKDFAAFVDATGYDATTGMFRDGKVPWQSHGITWKNPGVTQTPDDPVVMVSWNDAHAYCDWLTRHEQDAGHLAPDEVYRLPTDAEWSRAVGLHESDAGLPGMKRFSTPKVFPWGTQWPPPAGSGNYDISPDGYGTTSPVGSYRPNPYGLYDMGGNVWQWCEDEFGGYRDNRVLRGGSYAYDGGNTPASCFRDAGDPGSRRSDVGFRIVLQVAPISPP